MAGAQAAADPSMEDILASIRKIIQEDDDSPTEAAASADDSESQIKAELEAVDAVDNTAEVADQGDVDKLFAGSPEETASLDKVTAETPNDEPKKTGVSDAVDDDTVLLTADMRNNEASGRLQSTASDQRTSSEVKHKDDMSNVSDVVMPINDFDDDLDDDFDESKGFEVVKGVDEGDLDFVEPQLAEEPVVKPKVHMEEPVPPPKVSAEPDTLSYDNALTSPEVGAEVSGYLSSLTRIKAPEGAGTLEELVVSMLRPMLKDWLDAHLPGLVEQKVAEELRRLSQK